MYLCDADYIGFSILHLHQRVLNVHISQASAIGRHLTTEQGITKPDIKVSHSFKVLKKCENKIRLSCLGSVVHSLPSASTKSNSLTTEYPATVGNLFLRIRRSLKISTQLNQEQ